MGGKIPDNYWQGIERTVELFHNTDNKVLFWISRKFSRTVDAYAHNKNLCSSEYKNNVEHRDIDGLAKRSMSDIEKWALQTEWDIQPTNYGAMSDIIRAVILDEAGGIYIDTDCSLIGEFEFLYPQYGFYAATGNETNSDSSMPSNCVMASIPNGQYISAYRTYIAQKYQEIRDTSRTNNEIQVYLRGNQDLTPFARKNYIEEKTLILTGPTALFACADKLKIAGIQGNNLTEHIALNGLTGVAQALAMPRGLIHVAYDNSWLREAQEQTEEQTEDEKSDLDDEIHSWSQSKEFNINSSAQKFEDIKNALIADSGIWCGMRNRSTNQSYREILKLLNQALDDEQKLQELYDENLLDNQTDEEKEIKNEDELPLRLLLIDNLLDYIQNIYHLKEGASSKKTSRNKALEDMEKSLEVKRRELLSERFIELKKHYPTTTGNLVFRMDSRGPEMLFQEEEEGEEEKTDPATIIFESRNPDQAMITEGGENQNMVGGSKDCRVPTRYLGYAKINAGLPEYGDGKAFKNKADFNKRKNYTIYAYYVPDREGIDIHRYLLDKKQRHESIGKDGKMQGEDNIGSQEIATWEVKYENLLGYRIIGKDSSRIRNPDKYVSLKDNNELGQFFNINNLDKNDLETFFDLVFSLVNENALKSELIEFFESADENKDNQYEQKKNVEVRENENNQLKQLLKRVNENEDENEKKQLAQIYTFITAKSLIYKGRM